MCFLEVQGTAEDVVTMLVMVSCLVEGVIGAACAVRGWVLYDVLHSVIDEDGRALGEMSLMETRRYYPDAIEMTTRPPPSPRLGIIDVDRPPAFPPQWPRHLAASVAAPLARPARGWGLLRLAAAPPDAPQQQEHGADKEGGKGI